MTKNKELALQIVKTLQGNGFQAYFAGGCVRDMVMKKSPADYDIATDAAPAQISHLFKKTVFVGAQVGTALVIKNRMPFEVTTFRSGSRNKFSRDARTDVLNRDFTINGLLYDPVKKRLIDYCGGKNDIRKKLIRSIQTPATCFRQDRLRPLRAVRFASTLGFKIEEKTLTAVKAFKDEVNKVSRERLRGELAAILTGENPYLGVKTLDETGLLSVLLPEISALKGVEQPPKFHPEGDVFVHTMLLIKGIKNADIALALACLLHDVGKPATYKKTDRIRFHGHDKVGARLAEGIMRRFRFSRAEIRKVAYCVDNHMRVMNAMKMREATLKKMFLNDTFEMELELHRLDCAASHSDLRIYKFLKRRYAAFKKRPLRPKPLLNGYEIMEMGFKEGPAIGRIQKELVDLQLERKIRSKGRAREWVRRRWAKTKG